MYQYTVSESTVSENPHLPLLLKELDQLKNQKARLYFTYIEGDNDSTGTMEDPEQAAFTFVTPSKQMHLGFGMMSWDGQLCLAWLLEYEFQSSQNISPQLILYLEDRENGILVTRTEEVDGSIVFTFSTAN